MDSEEFRDCKLNWSSGYLKFFGSNKNDMGRVKGRNSGAVKIKRAVPPVDLKIKGEEFRFGSRWSFGDGRGG